MKGVYSDESEKIFLILSVLLLISLLYSFYILSLCMFGFGVLAFFQIQFKPFRVQWRPKFIHEFRQFQKEPPWYALSLIFFIVLLSGLYSDDTAYWLERLRIKVPFLLLPLAFYLIPSIGRATYHKILLAFLAIMCLSSLPIAFDMMREYSQMVLRLQQGQPIPTPGNHIRYSLLLALASLTGVLLLVDQTLTKTKLLRRTLIAVSIYLFIFIHLLAVRSGIAALYLTSLFFLLRAFWHPRYKVLALGLLVVMILTPVFAYFAIPSFQNRINYMMRDFSQYQSQKWDAYSDAERILSIRTGLDIAAEHPALGVGADLKSQMKERFHKTYDKYSFIMPHNQFVSVLASHGILGLFLFIIAILAPIWPGAHWDNHYFIALHGIIFSSFLVENTIETSVGVAIYLFFLLVGLNHMKANPS